MTGSPTPSIDTGVTTVDVTTADSTPPFVLGVDAADLALPSDMFVDTWTGFEVMKDVGGDGADDVVSKLIRVRPMLYEDWTDTSFEIWPDVLGAAESWVVTSPQVDIGDSKHSGVTNVWHTPDVTADGASDVWVGDRTATMLLAGPLDETILDPAPLRVADYVYRTPMFSDLDGDGTGELLVDVSVHGSSPYEGVARCEGPFVGSLDFWSCPMVVRPDWWAPHVLDAGDLDGDGIQDLLVEGSESTGTRLWVFDGGFADGADEPLLTVRPETTLYFANSNETRAALGDLDGDGLGDIVWVEQPDFYSTPEGEVAVLHSPATSGAEYVLEDATLHVTRSGGIAEIGGIARRSGGDAWLVLHPSQSVEHRAAATATLIEGASTGTIDPLDVAWFLAGDGITPVDGFVDVDACVGDFDGDTLGDVLVTDLNGLSAWIYLGASLP